jgi:hypothetical protein
MPYIELSVTTTVIPSSISIALGTATSINVSTITARAKNDDGTNDTTAQDNVRVYPQGIGSIFHTSSTFTRNYSFTMNLSNGLATSSFRGKDAGEVELIGIYDDNTTHRPTSLTLNVIANSALGGTTRPGGIGLPASSGGSGTDLGRGTTKINNQTVYRIILWDVSSTKARGPIAAIIHDAKNVGVSSYLNEPGEMFFTLPYNHPQITECVPLERHYRVDRFDEEDGRYITLGQGILEDYDATKDETVFYGTDYMGVLAKTITTPTTTSTLTYDNKTFESIYIDQMTQAVNQTDSRLKFVQFKGGTGPGIGWNHTANAPLVINSSTATYDIFTAGESRAAFLLNLANISMSGTTSKVVFGNTLESETELYNTFFCDMNFAPTVNNDIVLEFGGNVKSFSYSPGYRRLITRALLVATSITNAVTPTKIWSSVATGTAAPTSTYGVIEAVFTEEDIITQAAADAKAQYRLYQSSPEKVKSISVAITDGSIIPFKRYKIGDDIKVRIKRGIIDIDTNLTLRGQRYVGNTNGVEELWFDFFPRDAASFPAAGAR